MDSRIVVKVGENRPSESLENIVWYIEDKKYAAVQDAFEPHFAPPSHLFDRA